MSAKWALGLLMAALWTTAHAQAVSDDALRRIEFEQKLRQQISLDLTFQDEQGKDIRLGDYLGKRPAILVLGYYECPMLCTLVLNGLVETLQDTRWNPGRDFEVIDVSINPREKPALAAAKKRSYLKLYGRAGTEAGWHFLVGQEPAIRQLAGETGFHYLYDPPSRQFAHPSGLVILTPQGKVARYFSGVNFSAKELNQALAEASAEKTGSPIRQFVLLCFHYSPVTGKYGTLILTVVRLGGALTVLALGGCIARSILRERGKQSGARIKFPLLRPTEERAGERRHVFKPQAGQRGNPSPQPSPRAALRGEGEESTSTGKT